MLETRRRELEEEFQRVEDKAKARVERVRERGNQVVPTNEQDEELEELEAEIEMYAIALGEDKDEDFLNPSVETSSGPLIFPKTDKDETMETKWVRLFHRWRATHFKINNWSYFGGSHVLLFYIMKMATKKNWIKWWKTKSM